MVGDSTRPVPELIVRKSAETFLCHSQSPSFAEPRSTEKSDETRKITDNNGLVIRDGQKRQKPIPPNEIDEPEAKRTRGDEKSTEKPLTADHLASENARRLSILLCSNLDIHEMYKALRSSASAIPYPKSILDDSSPPKTEDVPNKSRYQENVGDRQKAILALFARRFGLRLCSETLHLGIALLDQFLDVMVVDAGTIGDLAAVTMAIASKVEEVNCLTIRDLIECSLIENKTVEIIGILERLVLTTLKFSVTVPTPLTFATYLLVHITASPTQICMTNYLLELALLDIETRRLPSDVVGHAATCLAVTIESEPEISPLKALQEVEIRLHTFCGIEMATSRSRTLMRQLAELFLDAPDENHSIFREYSTQRRHAVSLHPISTVLQKTLNIE